MALSNGTYAISSIDHILRRNNKNGATYVSRSKVLYTGGSSDTYDTGGVALVAASCGLNNINSYGKLAGGTTTVAYLARPALSWSAPKVQLFEQDGAGTLSELANGTSLQNVVIMAEVEGYV